MEIEPITIHVSPQAAEAFKSASPEEQRKLEALISLRLLEATRTTDALKTVMNDISQKAQQSGLTPEILQSILAEEPHPDEQP